jgi:hypothetical protein
LKKIFFFFFFVLLAIAFDGALAKDIFDFRIHTLSDWLGLALIIGIFLTLLLSESTKNHHD